MEFCNAYYILDKQGKDLTVAKEYYQQWVNFYDNLHNEESDLDEQKKTY